MSIYEACKLSIDVANFDLQVIGQGTGLHSKEEVEKMTLSCLKTLSDFLGTKDFLMGAEPVEEDATLFGFLCQQVFCPEGEEGPFQKALEDDCKNLKEYTERMKEKFWPDWDECLAKEKK